MSLVERFTSLLTAPTAEDLHEPEMLPSRLARACVQALEVDAAGLGVHSDPGLRIPIGASDAAAIQAERLQFSLGVGPAAEAQSTGEVLEFDEADIARNWPVLSASLGDSTPFQGVLSAPLQGPLAGVVVLDLYFRSAQRMRTVDRADLDVVRGLMTRELVRATLFAEELTGGGPRWMEGEGVRKRSQVWRAMGLVTMESGLESADALAALRARAFATGRLVDDLCDDVVSGLVDPADVLDPADG